MNRWKGQLGNFGENPAIDAFMDEIEAVCRKHRMSISHEDQHGAFEIVEYSQDCMEWLRAAHDDISQG